MTRPLPSAIAIGVGAPFLGCFRGAEAEIMAALYVEACRDRGDCWQPLGPKEIGEAMKRRADAMGDATWNDLVRRYNVEDAESAAQADGVALWLAWSVPVFAMGGSPDVHALVRHGFFTKDGDHGPIEPTDLFFEVLTAKGHVR